MNNPAPVKSEHLEDYLAESRGLERDYIEEILTSRRAAWRVARSAILLAVIALIVAVVGVKREAPPPVVLRVDNATGAVDVVTTMQQTETSYGEVVDTYWLNKYVLNREAYDFNSIQMMYDTTGLLSAPEVQQEYHAIYDGPLARDKVLQDHTRIVVEVVSIIPGPNETAVVRFTTQTVDSNGTIGKLNHQIATLGYKYAGVSMSAKDRRINPLGFQVTSYRADPETLTKGLQ